ncbi:imelysin family protein [uncultured Thiothrix sp.]|uniref:imelysin family protein n=1 Tax=uncultured Thiothrix sp. TaxID=223185 RepID=UPI00262557C7|nr:imelysin family protein [uncultured Thiothrix sp.]HMT93288.1 imelysin family protein [Thiolinea sp.]
MKRLPALIFGCLSLLFSAPTLLADAVTPKAVIENYANLAHVKFSDALSTAKTLQTKVDELIAKPSEATHQAAKQAWITARAPYSQTEVFRFGNPNVDEWEGGINAWPLDEGLIDYVQADSYEHEEGNSFATANIIAGNETITADLLKSYQEKGGSESNVATGYHAIEFLLWGQDLNADPKLAGTRSHTDFMAGAECTNKHCERRAQYLKAVTDLLVADLSKMEQDWAPEQANYRNTFMSLEESESLRRMLFGMGSLSLGELAGERMNVALLAHSQEDEHSCFSDNTHNDILSNVQGIKNVFAGSYQTIDGKIIKGASLAELLAAKDPQLSSELAAHLTATQTAAEAIVQAAQTEAFDQQIAAENKQGNARVKATIAALRTQTASIEAAAKALGGSHLNPEISSSLQ